MSRAGGGPGASTRWAPKAPSASPTLSPPASRAGTGTAASASISTRTSGRPSRATIRTVTAVGCAPQTSRDASNPSWTSDPSTRWIVSFATSSWVAPDLAEHGEHVPERLRRLLTEAGADDVARRIDAVLATHHDQAAPGLDHDTLGERRVPVHG